MEQEYNLSVSSYVEQEDTREEIDIAKLNKEIEEIVNSYPGVTEMHNLRTRQVGVNYAITMHVRMDGNISLYESHEKVDEIEKKLKERFGHQTIISIHVEPWK